MFANFFSQKKKKKKKKRKEKKIFSAFGLYEKITNFPIFLYRNNITTVIHHLKILINTKQLKSILKISTVKIKILYIILISTNKIRVKQKDLTQLIKTIKHVPKKKTTVKRNHGLNK